MPHPEMPHPEIETRPQSDIREIIRNESDKKLVPILDDIYSAVKFRAEWEVQKKLLENSGLSKGPFEDKVEMAIKKCDENIERLNKKIESLEQRLSKLQDEIGDEITDADIREELEKGEVA